MDEETKRIKAEFIKELYEELKYSINKLDTQALYLSGGALGLSLTFVSNLTPIQDAKIVWAFYSSVSLFAAAIIIGFIGHYISSRNISKRISDANIDIFKKENNRCTNLLNALVAISLCVGIIMLVFFTIYNIHLLKHQMT